jgi:hypothetical protein
VIIGVGVSGINNGFPVRGRRGTIRIARHISPYNAPVIRKAVKIKLRFAAVISVYVDISGNAPVPDTGRVDVRKVNAMDNTGIEI